MQTITVNCTHTDLSSLNRLLNVLDGVVDSPGRILIMTTNRKRHKRSVDVIFGLSGLTPLFSDVEQLDPALIRP